MVTVVVTGHSSRRSPPPRWTPTGDGLQRGQFCWPPLGRTVGRQRAATWPPLGRISWPPTRVHGVPPAAQLRGDVFERPAPVRPWRVAHRVARLVKSALGGAIFRANSVTEPASQPSRGQRHRRLCQTSLQCLPNAGRSTSATARSPSDHNGPPPPPQTGLAARQRTCTPSGSPSSSATPRTSHVAEPHQQLTHARRVALHRDPPWLGTVEQRRFWGIPRVQPRTPTASTPTSNDAPMFVKPRFQRGAAGSARRAGGRGGGL